MNALAPLAVIPLALALIGARSAPAMGAPVYVWWEAERPAETNFPDRSAFSPETFPQTRHLLSGGDWLSNSGVREGEEAFARYRVDVPAAGEYSLWTRKFWKHGPFRWRFGEDEWRVCGPDVALADDTYLREHLGANWVFLGKVALPAGPQTFEVRLLAGKGEALTAAFDCFVLASGPFVPNGKLKPGERSGLADPGFFPFEPAPDPFSPDALLDLREMNEDTAGQSGFVRREGDRLVLGDGRPARFWAVNVSSENAGQSRESVDYLARGLAKLGVNMVRFHSPLFSRRGDVAQVDPQALDNLHYLVAAMKRQGIYTTLSFYFPLWFAIRPEYGIPGYEETENKLPFALLYFDPRMQEIYKSWARALLTTPNPYTGLPLGKDPAVAIVEIINEDSFFFWTFTKQNVPPVHWRRLEEMYGRWLERRYGSLEAAMAAWKGERLPDDDPASHRAQLYEAWHMTGDGIAAGGPGKVRRVGDQVRFLTELQRSFYAGIVQYFRHDLGAQNLISCSNWTVSDPAMLDALERYTYTAGDVIDQHGYFGGRHKGEGSSYSVRVGHRFESRAAVKEPEALPIRFVQVGGYPQIISELGWTNPNRFRADACFLGAAYGALQGVDGIYWFAVGSNYLVDGGMGKFALTCPVIARTFPAAALMYRRGDVSEAQDAVHQVVALEDLFAMKGSGISSEAALDELRKADVPVGGEVRGAVAQLDPRACYVGRVVRQIDGDPSASRRRDLSAYIDPDEKTIRSLTGELRWNYDTGVALVDTPRSQGAAGFLAAAGRIDLGDTSIECDNEFASILVTSLDGLPLVSSRKILIQAMTEEQPYGFRVDGDEIVELGGRPFNVKKVAATVRFRGPAAAEVVALDENGYATDKPVNVALSPSGDSFEVRLAEDAVYHIVLR